MSEEKSAIEKDGDDFLSVPEVARKMGVHRNTVLNYIKKGAVPSTRLGRKILIPRTFIQKMKAEAGE
ncbi:MAG: helix-turn-helix domain-containing protein [Pseudomonadota bacterium]